MISHAEMSIGLKSMTHITYMIIYVNVLLLFLLTVCSYGRCDGRRMMSNLEEVNARTFIYQIAQFV